jgi:hypothetical protein
MVTNEHNIKKEWEKWALGAQSVFARSKNYYQTINHNDLKGL